MGWLTGWVGWTGGAEVFVGRMGGIVGGTLVLVGNGCVDSGWVGSGADVEVTPGIGVAPP